MAKAYEYEVRCPRCDVSFPAGTKKCLHCGGRTGPSHGAVPQMGAAQPRGGFDLGAAERTGAAEWSAHRPLPVDAEPEEEETPRGGIVRAAITVVWILAAVGFSLVRACSEQ